MHYSCMVLCIKIHTWWSPIYLVKKNYGQVIGTFDPASHSCVQLSFFAKIKSALQVNCA